MVKGKDDRKKKIHKQLGKHQLRGTLSNENTKTKRKFIVIGVVIVILAVSIAVPVTLLVLKKETIPDTTASTLATTREDMHEFCEVKNEKRGLCYWTEIHQKPDVDYLRAVSICKQMSMEIAVIPKDDPSIDTFISSKLMKMIPPHRYWSSAWTNMTVDLKTGVVSPPGSLDNFVWYGIFDAPQQKTWTRLFLFVIDFPVSTVVNSDPSRMTYGAVCSFPIP
uniref:uncharacterized protein LOC120332876 isoform X1 n=1 Tax=Styela clava TaxID=7725 RepID=UPI0019398868|nr:uncharacterized protein LOC120332876 isoform X1 [Styela clava]